VKLEHVLVHRLIEVVTSRMKSQVSPEVRLRSPTRATDRRRRNITSKN